MSAITRLFFSCEVSGVRPALMTVTEVGMIVYWLLAAFMSFGWINIDPSYMYSDYENPIVRAWNWSFFPIDVAFALCGLTARYAAMELRRAARLQIIGSTLMVCAGVMAISFWSLTADFNAMWWIVNIWLVCLGIWSLLSQSTDVL